MTAPALYEIEISEGDDGTLHPDEHLWTPCSGDATRNGFIDHHGLYICGIDPPTEDDYPVGFILLGHHRWADIIEAATAYMNRMHGWRDFHLYPGDDPAVLIPHIPRAIHTHGVFLRHPHPDYPCGCAWDDTWRVAWAPAEEPGAVPVTAIRHPAASVAVAGLPDADQGPFATWAM
ncbi:hypothetical protein [Streptomyces sp. NPDC017940]|uniref:hypothetical protein n=1 Tax=Streptomyces sp. NPDC017940 TaxID=3365017 RepID=UPI003789689D